MIQETPSMAKLWKPMVNSEGEAVEAEEMQLPFSGAYRARVYVNDEEISGRRSWTSRVDRGGRSATFFMASTMREAERSAESYLFEMLTAHQKLELIAHLEAAR